jgi:hypothetical protein
MYFAINMRNWFEATCTFSYPGRSSQWKLAPVKLTSLPIVSGWLVLPECQTVPISSRLDIWPVASARGCVLPPFLLSAHAPSLSPSVSRHVPSVHTPRSPGNKNPAVLAYDPTGLRSAMSATNQELEKALDRAMPNHNVRYAWQAEEEQIVKDCEAKGLPVPPGKRAKFAVPAMATQRRW